MDVRSTGIIGRASAVRINYRKWVGPSIDTTDPSHSEFQVWCSSVAWLWSYSLPKVSPNISKIGQVYVLLKKYEIRRPIIDRVTLLHIQQRPSVLKAVTTTKSWRAAAGSWSFPMLQKFYRQLL